MKHSDDIDKIRDFYNHVYHRGASKTVRRNRHITKLASRLRIQPKEEVLDVACGSGAWLMAGAARGVSVSGVDLSEVAIDSCRQLLPKGEFHVCGAESLPFAAKRFDVVTCLGSLEHFVDKVAALNEMVRVAKPEARFLILVPIDGYFLRRLGLYRGTYQKSIREDVLTLDAWSTLFREAGLQVIDRWGDTHVFSHNWITAGSIASWPFRLAVALAIVVCPLFLQYQVYHLCRSGHPSEKKNDTYQPKIF